MVNKCVICDGEFEASRSDARFCSAACRKKASRMSGDVPLAESPVITTEQALGTTAVAEPTIDDFRLAQDMLSKQVPEHRKRECKRSELCCTECVDFESGIHWCPNKGCGCWESKEEQMESLKAFERSCNHESTVMSRCLHCGAVLFTSKADRKGLEALRRYGCAKHNGSFSCGCEEKTVPKKSE